MAMAVLYVFADTFCCFGALILIFAPADMSLPISGICILLVITSVKLQIPKGTVAEKLGRMDWM